MELDWQILQRYRQVLPRSRDQRPHRDLHARKALEAGETLQRITLLRTWDECGGLFTEEECAALAIAEAATDLPNPEERIAAVASARLVLSDEQVAAIQWIAIAMNAFNRISILSRHPVKERELS